MATVAAQLSSQILILIDRSIVAYLWVNGCGSAVALAFGLTLSAVFSALRGKAIADEFTTCKQRAQ